MSSSRLHQRGSIYLSINSFQLDQIGGKKLQLSWETFFFFYTFLSLIVFSYQKSNQKSYLMLLDSTLRIYVIIPQVPSETSFGMQERHHRKIRQPSCIRSVQSQLIQTMSRNMILPDNAFSVKDPWKRNFDSYSFIEHLQTMQ